MQEVIDICEFAVGLSRQLHGLTIASERARHHMLERWHPLGPVAIVTAFNFPMAVWAWNATLAPGLRRSGRLEAVGEDAADGARAAHAARAGRMAGFAATPPRGLSTVLQGGREVGEWLADDPRFPLVSATGSTRMGRDVAVRVARRFGRSLLELGGNNATIVAPSARLDLAVRAITFAAVGTAGQRCTTLRRLFVHVSHHDRAARKAAPGVREPAGRQSARRWHAGRAADRPGRVRVDAARAAAGPRRRRRRLGR